MTTINNKVLITGGAGYIGSVLVPLLLERGYRVRVLDRLFFGIDPIEEHFQNPNFELVKDDIRSVDKEVFRDVDAVVHLASISNDPSCELDPLATMSINYEGSVRMAQLARDMGVSRFIFSSSCSVYGYGNTLNLKEESPLAPVSLYAKTKVMAEKELLALANDNFVVTILRNPTLYGVSKRMRFDLVVNVMTLSAFKNKKVPVVGGGLQWRPQIHIQDVIKAFVQVMETDPQKVQSQIFNVGASNQNFQVIQIAQMVQEAIPGTVVESVISDPDRRNYNVNFDKIRNVLGYSPEKNVFDGIVEMRNGLEKGILIDDIKTRTSDYYKYLVGVHKTIRDVTFQDRIF